VTGREVRLHPATARDLADLIALLTDFLRTSAAAHAGLTRYTRARPGYWTAQIIADLGQHAADLNAALENDEGISP
jgi:hypothetical protein